MFPILNSQIASAQTEFPSISCQAPLELELLENNAKLAASGVVTEQTVSETGLTTPSLWWAKEQFDPFGGKLVNNWLAYSSEKRIDLVVNSQLWTLLDYLERYRFVNEFGTVAREYGYNLRVFNQSQKCLATYRYNSYSNPPKWEINFDPSVENGLQAESTSNFFDY